MRRRATATALALACAAALPACGGDEEEFDPIPARQADAIVEQLAQIEDQSDNAACNGASDKLRQVREKVAALPRGIDPELRDSLEAGVRRLRTLVEDECEANREERRREREREEQETDTEPTETETVPTDTTPTETEPPPTEPPDTEPPPNTEPIDPEPEEPPITTPGGNVPPGQDEGGGQPGPKEDR